MSGHSKWNNIAKRKGANDAKKAKIFTKIGREMAIAIKEGGSANPDFNSRLRDCIAKAKANNMPNDNIKRTLDKYSGANGQVDYEANNYEGYGVGGVAVVVETLTDNKNRTVADVRHLFDKYGAGLGASGCVSWQFDKKGVIIMEKGDLDEDTVMMQALDAGAEDFLADEETFEIYTAPDDFSAVREALEKLGYEFVEAQVEMVPQNYITSRRKRIWRRCVSCSTTSRITTMCRPFGTTGRTRPITRAEFRLKPKRERQLLDCGCLFCFLPAFYLLFACILCYNIF